MFDFLQHRQSRIRTYKRIGFLIFLINQIMGWIIVSNEKIVTKNNQCVFSYDDYFSLQLGYSDSCDEDFCKRCEVIKSDCQKMKNINMQIVMFTYFQILYYLLPMGIFKTLKLKSPNLLYLKVFFEILGLSYLLGSIKFYGIIHTFEEIALSSSFIGWSNYIKFIYVIFIMNILNSCIYILLSRDLYFYYIQDVLIFEIFSESKTIQGDINQHLSIL